MSAAAEGRWACRHGDSRASASCVSVSQMQARLGRGGARRDRTEPPRIAYVEGVNASLRLTVVSAVAIWARAQDARGLPRFEDFAVFPVRASCPDTTLRGRVGRTLLARLRPDTRGEPFRFLVVPAADCGLRNSLPSAPAHHFVSSSSFMNLGVFTTLRLYTRCMMAPARRA